jgi:hypothetical protein
MKGLHTKFTHLLHQTDDLYSKPGQLLHKNEQQTFFPWQLLVVFYFVYTKPEQETIGKTPPQLRLSLLASKEKLQWVLRQQKRCVTPGIRTCTNENRVEERRILL